jgi:hypothetical protein
LIEESRLKATVADHRKQRIIEKGCIPKGQWPKCPIPPEGLDQEPENIPAKNIMPSRKRDWIQFVPYTRDDQTEP